MRGSGPCGEDFLMPKRPTEDSHIVASGNGPANSLHDVRKEPGFGNRFFVV